VPTKFVSHPADGAKEAPASQASYRTMHQNVLAAYTQAMCITHPLLPLFRHTSLFPSEESSLIHSSCSTCLIWPNMVKGCYRNTPKHLHSPECG